MNKIVNQEIINRSVVERTAHYASTTDGSTVEVLLEKLYNAPQHKQRSDEWFEFRHNLISASDIWRAVADTRQEGLIKDKCKPIVKYGPNTNTESTLHWGVKYEPLTAMMYEHKNNTKLTEFGCIAHPQYNFIGASPDGINGEVGSALYGRMVEIKNIVNREITGIPKVEYWIQMQIQMEVCDLDECDFVETRFVEYADESEYASDVVVSSTEKGVILYFARMNEPPKYEYCPFDVDDVESWISAKMEEYNSTHTWVKTIYWKLDQYSCVLVKRDRVWFSDVVGKIENVWQRILQRRSEMTPEESRELLTKKKKTAPLKIICIDTEPLKESVNTDSTVKESVVEVVEYVSDIEK